MRVREMNTNRPSIGSWIANPIQNPNLLQGPIPGPIQAPVQASLTGQLADSSGVTSHTTTILPAPNRNPGALHIQAIPAGSSGQPLTINTADLTTPLRSNIGIIQEPIKTTLTVHTAPTHGHQVHISSKSQPHHTSSSIPATQSTVAVATGMTITGTGVTTVTPTVGTGNATAISNSSGVTSGGGGGISGNSNSVTSGGGTTTTVTPTTLQTPQQQQQFQRLKVEDALSYLDQVKFKFNNQPQVYNDFLDIMKEFKSQSIDTPGVIQRVSNLFRGHPELIVGFNTFLPPGYKIEMQSNDQVNVSMPSSTSILIIHNSAANSVTSTPQMLHLPSSTPSQGPTHTTPHHTGVHLTTASTLPGQIGKTIYSSPSTQQTYLHNQNISTSSRSVPSSSTDSHHTTITHGPSSVTPQITSVSVDSNLTSNTQTIPIPVRVSPSPGIVGSLGTGPGPGIQSSGGGTDGGGGSTLNTTTVLGPSGDNNSTSTQPVEFNHAINYVNKIKNRFQGQPEVYKQFLEILHAYQKEQKCLKEGIKPDSKPLNESQVYAQVAKLFQNQEDLLQEFGQFLPDANAAAVSSSNSVFSGVSQSVNSNLHHSSAAGSSISTAISAAHHVDNLAAAHRAAANDHGAIVKKPLARPGAAFLSASNINSSSSIQLRRQPTSIQSPMNKPKMTSLRDVSLAEAGKYGSLNEYAFFDKVRKALRSQEVYENFLRCLFLYNHEIVSRNELVLLVTPFLGKFPELLKYFKDFLGYKDGNTASNSYSNFSLSSANNNNMFMEGLSQRVVGIRERDRERMNEGTGAEINYATCKRYGASYRALPKNYVQPECSGRTPLCKEVLNDTWVSFPSWSEDSTFVTSKKTQYEEFIYRCEDERFELDVVIETNLSTIRVLEAVQKKLSRMGPDDRAKYKLDECLGGTSAYIHQRSIRRIYGDKAAEIIDGLKKNPVVAVPLVVKRLKAKEEEWKEVQKQFNKIWREQSEKYYLKSLDHQGISFKQNDIKYIRSKTLLNEIETFYEERHEQNEENMAASSNTNDNVNSNNNNGQSVTTGPHMTFTYKNKAMVEEACNLIIHHVKRQTSIHKEDKQKIKQLLKHFIPDLFDTQRGDLSDDELEDFEIDKKMEIIQSSYNEDNNNRSSKESTNNTNTVCIPVNLANPKDNITSTTATTTTTTTITPSNIGDNVSGTMVIIKTPNDTEKSFTSFPTSRGPSALSATTATTLTSTATPSTTTTTSTTTTITPTANNNNNGQSCVNGNAVGQAKNVNPMLNQDPDDNYSLFFVNNYWYLFFRLHYILCDRLAQMHERTMILIAEEEKEKTLRKESTAAALRLKPKNDYEVEEYFLALIDMVKQVLDGNLEFNQFEDQLREMFGIHAYIAFTMDKVVQNIVRQLQHIVGDETCIQCTEMFIEEGKNGATGGPCSSHQLRANAETVYQKKAEQLLSEENCFKIIIYKGEGKVTIELIVTDSVESEDGGEVEKWSEYVEKYVKEVENEISDELKEKLSRKPVFLPRNLRMWRYKESKEKEERAAAELGSSSTQGDRGGGNNSGNTGVGDGGGGTKDEGETDNSLQVADDTQCKFNVNSYKTIFVVQSENLLCKRNALSRARKTHASVSRRLHAKFNQFHENWLEKEVANEQRDECEKWLMGLNYETEDVIMKSIDEIKETVAKESNIEDRTKLLTESTTLKTITSIKTSSSTISSLLPLSSTSSSSSSSALPTTTTATPSSSSSSSIPALLSSSSSITLITPSSSNSSSSSKATTTLTIPSATTTPPPPASTTTKTTVTIIPTTTTLLTSSSVTTSSSSSTTTATTITPSPLSLSSSKPASDSLRIKTRRIFFDNPNKSPYRPFCKYSAHCK